MQGVALMPRASRLGSKTQLSSFELWTTRRCFRPTFETGTRAYLCFVPNACAVHQLICLSNPAISIVVPLFPVFLGTSVLCWIVFFWVISCCLPSTSTSCISNPAIFIALPLVSCVLDHIRAVFDAFCVVVLTFPALSWRATMLPTSTPAMTT